MTEPKTPRFLNALAVRAEVHGWEVAWLHGAVNSPTQNSQPDLSLIHDCGRWVAVKVFPSDRARKIGNGKGGLTDHQSRILSRMARAGCELLIVAPTPEGDEAVTDTLTCGCDAPGGEIAAENAGERGFRPEAMANGAGK